MAMSPVDLQSIENTWAWALDKEYAELQARIRAWSPADNVWQRADMETVVEFLRGVERFLDTSYGECAAYLAANGHPLLQSNRSQVLKDIAGMRATYEERLRGQAAANQQEIENARRKAADECWAIFQATTQRSSQAWEDWLQEWRRVHFPPAPPRPNVCPYCNRVYGVTHSRAVCPYVHRIIWS
jgi:hypothetical protein